MGLFSNLVLLKIEVRNCGASMQFTSKVAFTIGKEKYLIKKKDTLSKFHRYTGGKKIRKHCQLLCWIILLFSKANPRLQFLKCPVKLGNQAWQIICKLSLDIQHSEIPGSLQQALYPLKFLQVRQDPVLLIDKLTWLSEWFQP